MNQEDPKNPHQNEERTNEMDKDSQSENSTQNELERWKSDYLYLKAEFENFRRNTIKERSDLLKYGSERFIVEILPVMDAFETALQSDLSPERFESFQKGIELTSIELRKALEKAGVSEINPIHEAFDPNLHEALSSQPTHDLKPGFIVTVFRKGYRLQDKVIRTAQVIVAVEPS